MYAHIQAYFLNAFTCETINTSLKRINLYDLPVVKKEIFKRDFVAKINDNEYLVCEYYSSLQHT